MSLPLDKTLPYIVYCVVDTLGNTVWHCTADSSNRISMARIKAKYADYSLVILDTPLDKKDAFNIVGEANKRLPHEYYDKFHKTVTRKPYKLTRAKVAQPPKVRRSLAKFAEPDTPDSTSSK